MAKLHDLAFDVKGVFPFPEDMLRYDGAEFFTQADRELAETTRNNDADEPVTIRVISRNVEGHFEPTFRRWESFKWMVDVESIRVTAHTQSRAARDPAPARGGQL